MVGHFRNLSDIFGFSRTMSDCCFQYCIQTLIIVQYPTSTPCLVLYGSEQHCLNSRFSNTKNNFRSCDPVSVLLFYCHVRSMVRKILLKNFMQLLAKSVDKFHIELTNLNFALPMDSLRFWVFKLIFFVVLNGTNVLI